MPRSEVLRVFLIIRKLRPSKTFPKLQINPFTGSGRKRSDRAQNVDDPIIYGGAPKNWGSFKTLVPSGPKLVATPLGKRRRKHLPDLEMADSRAALRSSGVCDTCRSVVAHLMSGADCPGFCFVLLEFRSFRSVRTIAGPGAEG